MLETIAVAFGIYVARIADVSFGTLRTICIVRAWPKFAALFGLLEVVIWLISSAVVLLSINSNPVYAIAYCLGYVSGIYVGMYIDRRAAMGDSVIRVLTKNASLVSAKLRADGCRVTRFQGFTKDGEEVGLLYVDLKKRDCVTVLREVQELDSECFATVDDVQVFPTH